MVSASASIADVAECAMNKLAWNARAEHVAMFHVTPLAFLSECIWESWRQPLQIADVTPWYQAVVVPWMWDAICMLA